MSADALAMVALIGLSDFWAGVLTAILGVSFWIIGLGILYLVYERYLKDKDTPDDT